MSFDWLKEPFGSLDVEEEEQGKRRKENEREGRGSKASCLKHEASIYTMHCCVI